MQIPPKACYKPRRVRPLHFADFALPRRTGENESSNMLGNYRTLKRLTIVRALQSVCQIAAYIVDCHLGDGKHHLASIDSDAPKPPVARMLAILGSARGGLESHLPPSNSESASSLVTPRLIQSGASQPKASDCSAVGPSRRSCIKFNAVYAPTSIRSICGFRLRKNLRDRRRTSSWLIVLASICARASLWTRSGRTPRSGS